MALAGCAGHAEDWKRKRFCFGSGHLLVQPGRIAGFGEGGNCQFDGRIGLCGTEPCGTQPHFLHLNAFG